MKVIEVQHLRKIFSTSVFRKKTVAVDDLSFSVEEGKIVGFLGANGAGKTTTIKALLGLIRPTFGTVKVLGGNPTDAGARAEIGFLPERPYFYEYLTGMEFLRFYASLTGRQIQAPRLVEVLEMVGLEHASDRQLRRFSKGMLQRIGVSQAIVHRPKLLILDEPMSGLDPDGRHDMASIIRRVRAEGATVFLSSHLLHDIEVLCDEVVMIEKGRLIIQSSVSSLLEKESRGFEITYRDRTDGVHAIQVDSEMSLQKKLDDIRAQSHNIVRVLPLRPSLEEIFVRYKREAGQ